MRTRILLCVLLLIFVMNAPRWKRRSGRRRLMIAGYEQGRSWWTGESLETSLRGTVPSISCPVGKYRPTGSQDSNYQRLVGSRIEGCEDCPRGRFGSATGLTLQSCTDACPLGRYRDVTGGKSVEDCSACPPGTYGDRTGLATKQCSGKCPSGKFSNVWALVSATDCRECPEGYRGWQCDWEIVAQHDAGRRAQHYNLDVRPAAKLRRSSAVKYREGSNHPVPLTLSIPYQLPLVNTLRGRRR